MKMDNEKVSAVTSWPTLTTNFYHQFIQNYTILTSPLPSLLKGRPKSLSWTPEADKAMQALKTAFTTAPLLRHPDPDKAFLVEVDASTTGVGAVLSQHQKKSAKPFPCAFFSKKLSLAEQNYDIGMTSQ